MYGIHIRSDVRDMYSKRLSMCIILHSCNIMTHSHKLGWCVYGMVFWYVAKLSCESENKIEAEYHLHYTYVFVRNANITNTNCKRLKASVW